MYEIDKQSKIPIYMQIYTQAISAIQNGVIKEGDRIQSIRELAKVLGVSVKTTKSAYEQLALEGYIESRDRSGYFVNKITHDFPESDGPIPEINISIDTFKNSGNAVDSFDHDTFQRIANNISKERDDLGKDATINGEESLRKEIIKFVGKYRNVHAHHNQVVIANNTRTLLYMILSLFDEPIIAYEEPGYEKAERLFKSYNTPIYPISQEKSGINIRELELSNANIVYLTPTHQYPTGTVMPIYKRLNILNWAANHEAYLIEDDYSGVLRYTGNPVPSIQSLDQFNRVIYTGSFQTLLSTSIKMSFMILPPELLKKFEKIKNRFDHTVSKLLQLTAAEYMADGYFDRHIKRLRNQLSKKAELVIQTLSELHIKYTEFQAGTYVIIHLPEHLVDFYVHKAKEKNIQLVGFKELGFLLFHYRGLEDEEIPSIIRSIFQKR